MAALVAFLAEFFIMVNYTADLVEINNSFVFSSGQ
jgi:hypothetical protein